MRKSKNVFVCIGALHYDYLFKLKNNIANFRTIPIIESRKIGGVAYNVSELLSKFTKVVIYSFKISRHLNKNICNNHAE